MSDIDLDGMKARAEAAAALAEKATAGLWECDASAWMWARSKGWGGGPQVYVRQPMTASSGGVKLPGDHLQAVDSERDAAFITAARSDVPALAADVLALVAERERLVGIINETIVALYEHELGATASALKARLDGAQP